MNDKRLVIGLAVLAGLVLLTFLAKGQFFSGDEPTVAAPAARPAPSPGQGSKAAGMPATPTVKPVQPLRTTGTLAVDPMHLAEAEAVQVRHQLYEAEAKATLPTLSVQTHNPVWALQYEARHGRSATSGSAAQGPMPAPESGPFGNIQPPPGEIWIRLPADQASQHRDLMAQHADLYRRNSGENGPVTVTLWVGGRPYARQQYK
ncbi:hypothetical protein [Desulfobacca acetoxidans]|nr:hypothetical protein [Desulfobacterales bacterium]